MGKEDIEPYQFKPGQSGNPNGRPLKVHKILKASGYTLDDIREAFKDIGWNDPEKLQEIVDDPKQPAILKVIARAFLKGAEKGDFRYISEILQHVIGKPKEQTENKHLHKIIVEYANPNDTFIPPSPGTEESDGGEEKV